MRCALTEVGLDVSECNHAAVGASTLVGVEGEPDRIVERDADERVHVLLAHVQEAKHGMIR